MPWPVSSSVTAIDLADLLNAAVNGWHIPQIVGAMDRAFDQAESTRSGYGANLVSRVESYVSKVNSYDTQIDADAANAGLKKADVLEWEQGGKLSGLRQERSRYVDRIMALLELGNFTGSGCRGRLLRS